MVQWYIAHIIARVGHSTTIMDEAPDDEFAVGIADNVRMPGLVAVELPLAVKPTERGIQAGLALIGGIEELSKVTADEVRSGG